MLLNHLLCFLRLCLGMFTIIIKYGLGELYINNRHTTATSWSEVDRYVQFLNVQLLACEKSIFFDTKIMGMGWNELKIFAAKMMVSMCKVYFCLNITFG